MTILIAYASKHGATQGIAERLAEKLRAAGQDADARPAATVASLDPYDAFIIGSAVYYGSWQKDASGFVRQHASTLAAHPVWLFSSGPIGSESTDREGRDVREAAVPKEIAELTDAIKPRGHRVFFGAMDRSKLGFVDRVIASMPAFPGAEGDFRDWADIESWAEGIAHELAAVPIAAR